MSEKVRRINEPVEGEEYFIQPLKDWEIIHEEIPLYEAPQDEATLARVAKTRAIRKKSWLVFFTGVLTVSVSYFLRQPALFEPTIRLVGECGHLVGFFLMVAGICEKARDNHIIYQTKAKPNVGLH
jgi:hypothetical protein